MVLFETKDGLLKKQNPQIIIVIEEKEFLFKSK